MVILWVCIIVFVIFLFFVIYDGKNKEKTEFMMGLIAKIPNFTPSALLQSAEVWFAIDQQSKTCVALVRYEKETKIHEMPFDEITGVEIESIEGSTSTVKSGLLKFDTNSPVVSLGIRITFSYSELPFMLIPLYFRSQTGNSSERTDENDRLVRATESANYWHGLLKSIVLANAKNNNSISTPISTAITCISSSLDTLFKLYSSGALSDEEYKAAKNRILQTPLLQN